MNRINEIDNTIEGKEIKTYYQDHPELVVLSGRLYGKVTYVEYFDAYYLQFGDNVYYFPQKDSYQEGKNWKKKKFDSYEECLNFSQQHNIKIVMKSTVKSPFSNGLPDPRFLFPKRNTPYDPSERIDVSRIRENKQYNKNRNMKQTIKLRESELKRMIAETIRSVVNENSFHRGYKAGRNLDVLDTTDGSYRDEDIFSCLAELKSKLKQAEARAKMPQYGNEGEARNYLVAAIRGLQDFINCHY